MTPRHPLQHLLHRIEQPLDVVAGDVHGVVVLADLAGGGKEAAAAGEGIDREIERSGEGRGGGPPFVLIMDSLEGGGKRGRPEVERHGSSCPPHPPLVVFHHFPLHVLGDEIPLARVVAVERRSLILRESLLGGIPLGDLVRPFLQPGLGLSPSTKVIILSMLSSPPLDRDPQLVTGPVGLDRRSLKAEAGR